MEPNNVTIPNELCRKSRESSVNGHNKGQNARGDYFGMQ